MNSAEYQTYVNILKTELVPAMGCTEPIAVAYAAALSRKCLGAVPQKVTVTVSGNILKNVKGVVVPNTGGMKGVISAAAAGIVAGNADAKLQVLSCLRKDDIEKISAYIRETSFSVEQSRSDCVFDIGVRAEAGGDEAFVRITGHHTNVVTMQKNGKYLLRQSAEEERAVEYGDKISVEGILEFAACARLADVEEVLKRQIEYNRAIAEEGLNNDYGARVGKVLLKSFGNEVHNLAKAMAAAGSDARMNGCSLPVVIVSGSGNQGMTASLPVLVYAEYLGASEEELLRALIVSNLVTVHLKAGIGKLSAYCGAVSAGCGAGAGVCYLRGGRSEEVARAISNALAIDSGLICDGAKSSCAAKIASAVEAGLIGMEMSLHGSKFCGGDGILEEGVEDTIENVGDIARNGMRATDEEIIRLMIKKV